MERYQGYFELHVWNRTLVPVFTEAFREISDHQLKLASERHGFAIMHAEPPWLPYPTMGHLCTDIRVVETVFRAELETRKGKDESFVFPWFDFLVTVFETEPNGWKREEKKLEGFPNCSLGSIHIKPLLHAEISSHDSDYSGRTGRLHRAIRLRRRAFLPFTIPSLTEFLSDDGKIGEVFRCFEHFHG